MEQVYIIIIYVSIYFNWKLKNFDLLKNRFVSIDNNSIDHSVTYIKENYLEAYLIENKEKKGYWWASNRSFIYDNSYENDKLKKWIEDYSYLYQKLNLNINNVGIITNKLFSTNSFFLPPNNKIGEPTTVLFSKVVFNNVGKFNINLKQMLDYEYWYRVLKTFPIGIINENLVSFRLHPIQATPVNENNEISESNYYFKFIEKELYQYLSIRKKIKIIWKRIKS